MMKPVSPATAPRLHRASRRAAKSALAGAIVLTLTACANDPKTPDWQMETKGATDRAVAAYLQGNARVEAAEMARARQHIASTGRADLLAATELLNCAARVASLVFEPCAPFETLRPDATEAQRAYADYLRGQASAAMAPQLPPAQRAAATRTAMDSTALLGIEDPLSLLVAAGVLLQRGNASPAVVNQAVNAASEQGWRRPLMAWLGVQAQRAQQSGNGEEEAHIRRRIALVMGESAGTN